MTASRGPLGQAYYRDTPTNELRRRMDDNVVHLQHKPHERAGGSRMRGESGEMMPGPIAVKLRVLREERGLTQKQAAELAHVTLATLRDLESGKRPPYMPTLTKIARGYGVPVEELVEESPRGVV